MPAPPSHCRPRHMDLDIFALTSHNDHIMDDASLPCSVCGHPNAPGSRHCGGCGAAVPLLCQSCGTHNPVANRFCVSCGSALTGSVAPAPPATASPIRPAPPTTTAGEERRLVTVLFADLVGF